LAKCPFFPGQFWGDRVFGIGGHMGCEEMVWTLYIFCKV